MQSMTTMTEDQGMNRIRIRYRIQLESEKESHDEMRVGLEMYKLHHNDATMWDFMVALFHEEEDGMDCARRARNMIREHREKYGK